VGVRILKRAYQKPDIYFDSFAMCTSIAGACGTDTNTPAQFKCGLEYTDTITIFAESLEGACNFNVAVEAKDAEWDGICYHVPYGTNNLFNS
jgi:hypothetical protein